MNTDFLALVDRSGGDDACWPWRGSVERGFGRVSHAGSQRLAHRLTYEALVSNSRPLRCRLVRAPGCEVSSCCNPKHWLDRGADFWRFVDKAGPVPPHMPHLEQCWVWTGAKNAGGYGQFKGVETFKSNMAHRRSYWMAHGALPTEAQVLHRCDNPACVRPSHLFLGTNDDNVADKMAKGRESRTGCPGGDSHWMRRMPDRIARGSRQGGSVLSEPQVLSIRERHAAGERQSVLALAFGVDRPVIHCIIHGKTWAHVGGPVVPSSGMAKGAASGTAKLTDADVRAIRASSDTQRSLADQYGVTQTMIGRIRRGVAWRHVA